MEITGKYLFFSDDKRALISLAKKLLEDYKLSTAKVNNEITKANKGFGHVLCVYDSSPRYKTEFKQFADFKKIYYRYWKSDEDTIKGVYSDEFKKKNPDRFK